MNGKRNVTELISVLLSHYRVEGDSVVVTGDWIEDLSEFDAEVVAEACREWRRSSTRRPVIAEIRSRCREITSENRAHRPSALSWDREAYAREAGFSSWAERQEAIERVQNRYRLAEAERQKWADVAT